MAEPYETPPHMQDIYDKDKEENKETDELIRQGKLKEAAKKKLGTRMFDSIESGVTGSIQWLQKQAEENPDTYTDDVLRLLGGGIKNTAWAISKIPLLDKLAEGEDWLAKQARGLSEELTPWLDPRFAGWGTRIGTGILADKGARKVLSGIKGFDKARRINLLQEGKGRFGQVLRPLDNAPTPSQRVLNPNLAGSIVNQIDNPNWRYTTGDIPAPPPAWQNVINQKPINLAEEIYRNSPELLEEGLEGVRRYTGGVRGEALDKWMRETFKPAINAAADEIGWSNERFYSLLASRPEFAYIEHKIAKTPKLEWFWRRFGNNVAGISNPDDISNLRVLLNDRYKLLKDAVESQFYGKTMGRSGTKIKGINDGIKKHSERYIIDVEGPTSGKRFITLEHNPGNLVIRKAGSGKPIGMIGEYYEVLYSDFDALSQSLLVPMMGWQNLTPNQLKNAIRKWRNGIIQDHINIIKRKEIELPFEDAKRLQKINLALIEDMVDFREKYKHMLPELTEGVWSKLDYDMTAAEVESLIKKSISNVPVPKVPITKRDIKKPRPTKFKQQTFTDWLESDDPFPPKTIERRIIEKKYKSR